jgi:hypothetical protein
VQTRKERENMSEAKPKIEGAKKFCRPMRAAGQPIKKEFVTKVLGLESHTFDIGNAKYASKYKKTVDAIANYIQRKYKGGADIAKAIKALSLPTLQVPGYPKAKAGETAVDPGDVYVNPPMRTTSLCVMGSPYAIFLAISARLHTRIPICIRQSLSAKLRTWGYKT